MASICVLSLLAGGGLSHQEALPCYRCSQRFHSRSSQPQTLVSAVRPDEKKGAVPQITDVHRALKTQTDAVKRGVMWKIELKQELKKKDGRNAADSSVL